MATQRIDGDLVVTGGLRVGGSIEPPLVRAGLAQEQLVEYPVALTDFRVWDAVQTLIPGTAASDDLGISGGTWATHAPKLTTGDVKTTTVTRRARVQIPLPAEYEAGQTLKLRLNAGMETTVADGSATVDVEAYLSGRDGTIDGSDLITTAAISINTLGFLNRDFTIDPSTLAPGDELDVRVTVAVVDTATATAVIASIGAVELLADIRG